MLAEYVQGKCVGFRSWSTTDQLRPVKDLLPRVPACIDGEMATVERLGIFVAIDFGTTFSGYAFAMGPQSNEIFVLGSKDKCSGKGCKVPTALLLDKHGELLAFGKDALETYFFLEDDEEIADHFFFDRFKMMLKDDSVRFR